MKTIETTALGQFEIEWGVAGPPTALGPYDGQPSALTFRDPLYPDESKTLMVYVDRQADALCLVGELTNGVWAVGRPLSETADMAAGPVEFSFGDSPELADELLALVLSGRKTATCGALRDYGGTEPMPVVGRRDVVLDGQGRRAAVIETVEAVQRRFDEVDEDFARDEGEGDLSYDYWRQAHEAYFERNGGFSPDLILVCERFRLVEILDREPSS